MGQPSQSGALQPLRKGTRAQKERPYPPNAGWLLGTHLLQLPLLLIHVAELGRGAQEARRVDDDHIGAEAVLHTDHNLARVEAPQLVVLQALILTFDVLLSGGWMDKCGEEQVSRRVPFISPKTDLSPSPPSQPLPVASPVRKREQPYLDLLERARLLLAVV